jgi:hypothetical protein
MRLSGVSSLSELGLARLVLRRTRRPHRCAEGSALRGEPDHVSRKETGARMHAAFLSHWSCSVDPEETLLPCLTPGVVHEDVSPTIT